MSIPRQRLLLSLFVVAYDSSGFVSSTGCRKVEIHRHSWLDYPLCRKVLHIIGHDLNVAWANNGGEAKK